MYPSEYAYRDDSVATRVESSYANCRRYPAGNLPGGVHPDHYIHCNGTQLKLIDSNFGQERYQSTDYYVWSAGGEQLLFIFSRRVSLTAITLHYYSDSVRGRPRLRFYVVPDNFDVWGAPTSGNQYVGLASVPPNAGGEPAGRRRISVNANFNTKKILMYMYEFNSSFMFAVSEVEFFRCNSK
jgi:hypothetical protein